MASLEGQVLAGAPGLMPGLTLKAFLFLGLERAWHGARCRRHCFQRGLGSTTVSQPGLQEWPVGGHVHAGVGRAHCHLPHSTEHQPKGTDSLPRPQPTVDAFPELALRTAQPAPTMSAARACLPGEAAARQPEARRATEVSAHVQGPLLICM